uniref:Trafficking protein particle complex subunit n=1 Tax=Sinocyclocheilus anshuiensis TaxID=1608454 RepID=A0A671RPK2_9TELE
MAICSVFVVNKAGGLIYQYDIFRLDIVLKIHDEKVVVSFGQRDGVREMGHAVLSINGVDVNVKYTAEGKEILEYLRDPANYPVSIRFGRPRLTSNEKLMLASMFHSYIDQNPFLNQAVNVFFCCKVGRFNLGSLWDSLPFAASL